MVKMAIAVDISECYPEVKNILALIPFPISEHDFWQAILDVWLAKYADARKDLNVIVGEQVDRLLIYRSEGLCEYQNELEYRLTSTRTGITYLTSSKDLVTMSLNKPGNDFTDEAKNIVSVLTSTAVLLASNKSWNSIYKTIASLVNPLQWQLKTIELVTFTPKVLIAHVVM